eukprot:4661693-Prorocentrum_lima.AAC.1
MIRVNQSQLRANPDPWDDVHIPGLEGRDLATLVQDASTSENEASDGSARGMRPASSADLCYYST